MSHASQAMHMVFARFLAVKTSRQKVKELAIFQIAYFLHVDPQLLC
jgi:hypothetical protein